MVRPGKEKRQPKSTTVLTSRGGDITKKKNRRVIDVTDDEEDASVAVDLPPARGRGRPRKTPVEKPPLYNETLYDANAFSLCVEKKGEHLPLVWFTSVCDYLNANAREFDASTEVGPRAGHLHLQAWFEAHVPTDIVSQKALVAEIKIACNTRHGDGSGILVYLKPFGSTQTKQRMTGYVRKDRNLATFNNRSKGVTQEMIDAGIAEHASLKMSPMDGKIIVNKANLFNKACAHELAICCDTTPLRALSSRSRFDARRVSHRCGSNG